LVIVSQQRQAFRVLAIIVKVTRRMRPDRKLCLATTDCIYTSWLEQLLQGKSLAFKLGHIANSLHTGEKNSQASRSEARDGYTHFHCSLQFW